MSTKEKDKTMIDLAKYLPDGAVDPHVKEVYRGHDIISYQVDSQPENVEAFAIRFREDGKQDRVTIIGMAGNDEYKSKNLQSAKKIIDRHLEWLERKDEWLENSYPERKIQES